MYNDGLLNVNYASSVPHSQHLGLFCINSHPWRKSNYQILRLSQNYAGSMNLCIVYLTALSNFMDL